MKNINFKHIELKDKESFEYYLYKYSSFCLSSYTFSSLISWNRVYKYTWAVVDDTLLIKFTAPEKNQEQFMQPIGEFPEVLQEKLLQFAETLEYKLSFYGVSNAFISKFPKFVSNFTRIEHREMDNYVYKTEDLALLNGSDYQAKRNLINQFESNYNWSSESITSDNTSDCLSVINKIYSKEELNSNMYLAYELNALNYVLKYFSELKEEGVLIRINNEPVAFAIFEHLNNSTCVVHFEKAIREFKGLYQLVNRETAIQIRNKGCEFINREEDLGIEGLRKAKLSYHPTKLCTSDVLVFKK